MCKVVCNRNRGFRLYRALPLAFHASYASGIADFHDNRAAILGGALLLVLGIIGEYIGRIYICINNSPQYVIRSVLNAREEKTSSSDENMTA